MTPPPSTSLNDFPVCDLVFPLFPFISYIPKSTLFNLFLEVSLRVPKNFVSLGFSDALFFQLFFHIPFLGRAREFFDLPPYPSPPFETPQAPNFH